MKSTSVYTIFPMQYIMFGFLFFALLIFISSKIHTRVKYYLKVYFLGILGLSIVLGLLHLFNYQLRGKFTNRIIIYVIIFSFPLLLANVYRHYYQYRMVTLALFISNLYVLFFFSRENTAEIFDDYYTRTTFTNRFRLEQIKNHFAIGTSATESYLIDNKLIFLEKATKFEVSPGYTQFGLDEVKFNKQENDTIYFSSNYKGYGKEKILKFNINNYEEISTKAYLDKEEKIFPLKSH